MTQNQLMLIVYAAVALIVAAVLFLLRDLFGRRPSSEDRFREGPNGVLDLRTLLPSADAAAREPPDTWLGQLVAETRSDFTVDTALLLALMIGLMFGGAMFLWRDDLLAGAAGVLFGVVAVGGFLCFLRFRRFRAIREQLPDVMDLMARAVRAGESLDQAITLAGESNTRPVAAEFQYCASQMKMGLSLESAIRGMVGRAPLTETRILAMTLIVQRRRGGHLPTTLERLAKVFRDRGAFQRQFQAATALGRGSAILIALIGLGLDAFVILGHAEYAANLMQTNIGHILLGLSLFLQFVGITWAVWLFRSHY
jgi:tight adherence protein B